MSMFSVKMNKIYGLFVILGVFGEFAICQQFVPIPYEHQNNIDPPRILFKSLFDQVTPTEARNDTRIAAAPTQDLPRTLFGNYFDKVNSIDARNDTPTTAAPTTTTTTTTTLKPAQSTTEEVVFIPFYEVPIYEPNYYEIPPYPYNAPEQDQRLLLDNFEPNYPLINRLPSMYPQTGIQSLPFFNPSLINGAQENPIWQPVDSNPIGRPTNVNPRIGIQNLPFFNPNFINGAQENPIWQPIDSNPIRRPTNVNPPIGIENLPYFNPSWINAAAENTNSQPDASKSIPRPTNAKPSIVTSPLQNENIKYGPMTDADRNTLSKELQKLIADFILQEENKMDPTFGNGHIDDHKTLAPWSSTFVPQVSTSSNIPVVEDVNEENQQPDQTNEDRIPLGNGSVSNSSSDYKQLPVTEPTTQSSVEMNQTDSTTDSQNVTDDSRKLDFDTVEEDNEEEIDIRGEFSTIATPDKSSTIYSPDLIKQLESNQTQSTTSAPSFPKFFIMNGKNCSVEMGKFQGENRQMIICPEESFDGKSLRRTTSKSNNVTFYTEELPTTMTESTNQIFDETSNKSSGSLSNELVDTAPLNTEPHQNTTDKLTTQLKKDNGVLKKTTKTHSLPCERKKIETALNTTAKVTTQHTTEDPILSSDSKESEFGQFD